jgi:toxin-antitoxin system PIN domain toxin
VSVFLLDVNLLVTMHLPDSAGFSLAQNWFKKVGSRGFASCAITQSGFVRVLTQLAVKNAAISPEEKKVALQQLTSMPGHAYWPMDIEYLKAIEPFERRMQGYRPITDAFLLGLAVHHKGELATMDEAILHLAGREFASHVEFVK